MGRRGVSLDARHVCIPDAAVGEPGNKHQGPPTVEDWEASFKVFSTAPIMLDAVDPYVVLGDGSYSAFLVKMAHQFGTQCYPLLYQTETRFRREELQHIRRREFAKLNELILIHGPKMGVHVSK